jgi:hypothetical protein
MLLRHSRERFLSGPCQSSYIGNYFELWNERGYPFWGSLGEALKTGKPQNEIKRWEDVFEAVYAIPDRLRLFLRSMTGHSLPSAMAIAEKFPWRKYKTFVDIGAAEGCLPVRVALAHQHLVGESFDLSAVRLSSKNTSPLSGYRIGYVFAPAISSTTQCRPLTCS